ncbi:MAG: hypothetical protein FWD98_05545 [Defluviitaleaceae bacterium]|nr:hypothetical protein [Defluviitaleaceae bacterium]
MNTDRTEAAIRLLSCMGDLHDSFLEEAESADIAGIVSAQKKLVKYSTLAAAASFGLAVTYWLLRSKKVSAGVRTVMRKSA